MMLLPCYDGPEMALNPQMVKSPAFAQLWLSPSIMKPFAQVPARAKSSFLSTITPQSGVVFSFGHSQRFRQGDLGCVWTHCSALNTGGVEEGVSLQHPTPSSPPPISLSLALYLVTLVQGLEWAATSFPLPGRSHNSVFCSWKKREKNQRRWEGLLLSPSLEMPKLGGDIVP